MKICIKCDKLYEDSISGCQGCGGELENYSKISIIISFINRQQAWFFFILHKFGLIGQDFKDPKDINRQEKIRLETFIFTMTLLYNILRIDCDQEYIDNDIYEIMKHFIADYGKPEDIDDVWDRHSQEYIDSIESDENNKEGHLGLITVHAFAKNMITLDEKGEFAQPEAESSDPLSLFMDTVAKSGSGRSINKLDLWQKFVITYWEIIEIFCLTICKNTKNFIKLSDKEFETRRQQANAMIEDHKCSLH